ncbi:hypothetical protein P5V15_004069 [Pogonomyrmex californicus]
MSLSPLLRLCVTTLQTGDNPLLNFDDSEHVLADVHLEHLGGFKMPSSSKIHSPFRFPCPQCPSIFNRKNNLYSHLKYECGQLPRFGCPYCEYTSKKSSNIRAHVRRKHYGYEVDVIRVPLV